jgi:GT2 family glycosyltransferase
MISIVICSVDARKLALSSSMYQRLLSDVPHEIVHIPDARGLCEGYNRGFARSRGETVIFSHDDVEFRTPDFARCLLGHMEHCDVAGVAGTDKLCGGDWSVGGLPHNYGQVIHSGTDPGYFRVMVYSVPTRRIDRMQALDGIFLCCRREVVERVPFDQTTFTGYHMYDMDFTYRAYRAGYRLSVCADLDAVHAAVSSYDEAWNGEERKFRAKHAATLAPTPLRWQQFAFVVAPTMTEALEITRPGHWDQTC